jgi:hypothetical protein
MGSFTMHISRTKTHQPVFALFPSLKFEKMAFPECQGPVVGRVEATESTWRLEIARLLAAGKAPTKTAVMDIMAYNTAVDLKASIVGIRL